MTGKLTSKQETFALAYIETGNASEAYRRAYAAGKMKPETVNRKAKELLDNGKITARVAELQAGHQERHDVTVDSLTEELEDARSLATKNEQPSAVVSAVMGKAKIHGMLTDKHEHSGPDGGPIDSAASSEWQTITVAVARKLAVIMHRMWMDGSKFQWGKEVANI